MKKTTQRFNNTSYITQPMIKKFLKAKHWQLFILVFGLPMLFYTVMMVTIFISISNGTDPSSILFGMAFFPIVMLLFISMQFGWLWSIAIGLQPKVPENVTMKVKKFKLFFFVPLIYIVLISIFMGLFANQIMQSGNPPSIGLVASFMVIIIPLHLFSIFCIFYTLYFVAKTFKTVELQREVRFSDFVGEFFMIWFYPVGIWIIQPKLNKMIES